jgi:hypothetical protein
MAEQKLKITVSNTAFYGSNKNNFIMPFTNGIGNFPTTEFFSGVLDVSGLDIRFYSDEIKTTEYKRYISYFDSGSEKVKAFVQIPVLNTASNLEFYCFIGGVTRLNDTDLFTDISSIHTYTMDDLFDKSGSNNLSAFGASFVNEGPLGRAISLNPLSNGRLELDSNINFEQQSISFECWVNPKTFSTDTWRGGFGTVTGIFAQGKNCTTQSGGVMRGWTDFDVYFGTLTGGDIKCLIQKAVSCSAGSQYNWYRTNGEAYSANQWFHVVFTIDDNLNDATQRTIKIYINGALVISITDIVGAYVNVGVEGGQKAVFGAFWDHILMDFQHYADISLGFANFTNTLLDVDWIKTNFEIQSNISTVMTSDSLSPTGPIELGILHYISTYGQFGPDGYRQIRISTYGQFDGIPIESDINPDIVNNALELLLEQFEEKPNIVEMARAFMSPMVELEYVMGDYLSKMNLRNATGDQLDIIGDKVLVERGALNDDQYRAAILLQIFLNKSSGEPENIITALKTSVDTAWVKYTERYPAGIILSFGSSQVIEKSLLDIIKQVTLAGVKLILQQGGTGKIFGFKAEGGLPQRENIIGFGETGVGNENLGGQFVDLFS